MLRIGRLAEDDLCLTEAQAVAVVQRLAAVDAAAVDERPVARKPVVHDGPLPPYQLEQGVCPRDFRVGAQRDVGVRPPADGEALGLGPEQPQLLVAVRTPMHEGHSGALGFDDGLEIRWGRDRRLSRARIAGAADAVELGHCFPDASFPPSAQRGQPTRGMAVHTSRASRARRVWLRSASDTWSMLIAVRGAASSQLECSEGACSQSAFLGSRWGGALVRWPSAVAASEPVREV